MKCFTKALAFHQNNYYIVVVFFLLLSALVGADDLAQQSNNDFAGADDFAAVNEIAEIISPLFINGNELTEIFLQIELASDTYSLEAETLLALLSQYVEPNALNQLDKETEFIDFSALKTIGLTPEFDQASLVVKIFIPPTLRAQREINLQGRESAQPTEFISPNKFSAALETRVVQEWTDNDEVLSADFDGHINLFGWVLQNRHRYQDSLEATWQRQETQLIKDFTELPARLSLGDVSYPIVGLMGREDLSGLSMTTRFDLRPYEVAFPTFDQQLVLEEDSRVDVFANGTKRRSVELPAGVYSLLDIPVLDGVSDVTLEITDRFGRVKRLDYFGLLNRTLLKKGLSEYSFSAGVARVRDEGGIDYEQDQPIGSAFYRYGLTDTFTIGAHAEANEHVVMTGVLGENTTIIGDFNYGVGISQDREASDEQGTAAQIGYSYRRAAWGFSAGLIWQDEYFSRLGQRADDDNVRYLASAGLSLPRLWGWSTTFSVSENDRYEGDDRRLFRIFARRDITRSWRVNLEFSHVDDDIEKDNIVNVQFYWSPPRKRWFGNVGYTNLDNQVNYELQYQRNREIGFNASVRGRDSDLQTRHDINTSYISSMFEARADASETHTKASDDNSYRRSVSFGTSLVYVGGRFGISRPLGGLPFALFKGRVGLGEGEVGIVRGRGAQPISYVNGAKDTGVFPRLSTYFVNKLTLNTDNVPYDIDVEEQEFALFTTYRSGTLVEVGNEAEVYVTGHLLDATGNPVSLAIIKLRSMDQPELESIEFFTDNNGYFEVDRVPGGNYQLAVGILPEQQTEVAIPFDTIGTIELGTIQLNEVN